MRKCTSVTVSLILIFMFCPFRTFSSVNPFFYNILDYGARADSSFINTGAIQSAIDACARAGGGTVYFPAGKYISGTLCLKSHITLNLDAGAVLMGSVNIEDYPVKVSGVRSYTDNYTDKSLIYGDGLEYIGITGQGIINGNGKYFDGPYKVRPFLIRLINCKNVLVRDVTMMDSPMWLQHYLACENVNIDGITVNNRHDHVNNDGIDIDACNEVRISNCRIISGDDAIVLKSTLNQPCKNITITNCIISTNSNAIKVGSETTGNFENIVIGNCTFYDTHLGGIALQIMDGGNLNGVSVSDIVMKDVGTAILIRLGNRARPFNENAPRPGIGSISNISFNNIMANNTGSIGCSVTGLPGHSLKNISFKNVKLTFPGGGQQELANREIPDNPSKYPDVRMFGMLPAYGFFCRNAENLTFNDVELELRSPDARPAIVCEKVTGLELCKIKAPATGNESLIRCTDVKNLNVQSCIAPAGTNTFLEIRPATDRKITMVGNDFSGAKNEVTWSDILNEEAASGDSKISQTTPESKPNLVAGKGKNAKKLPVKQISSHKAVVSNNLIFCDIDNNKYKITRLGNQVWMAENLKTTRLNDGTPIPNTGDPVDWTNLSSPGYSWYINDSLNNKNRFGALYNWHTINTGKLCPGGWHVPAGSEWEALVAFLGGKEIAGGKMWYPGSVPGKSQVNAQAGDSGFSALPGGYRDYAGRYFYQGSYGGWWSSDEYFSGSAWSWYIYNSVNEAIRNISGKTDGYSVRCIKDPD